ncbi:MAG: HU family DNA-binding protein [Ornithinibacter sp.]
MNKSQLIDTLADRYEGNRKQAAHALESVIDTITREVAKGEKVAITGFGSFEKRIRDARWVRNPRTGERLKAKKTAIPKFSAGADLKAVVSGAKKLPKLTLDAAKAATGTGAKKASSTSKSAAKKTSSTTKSAAKKGSSATKSAAKKTSSTTKSAAKKATPAKKTAARKSSPATKTAAKKSSPAKKTSTAKKSPAKKSTTSRTAKKS